MSLGNSFAPGQTNEFVDEMFQDSYEVVKRVYRKLPVLEEFQNNVNLDSIEENLDTLKTVTSNLNTIQTTNANLEAITSAPKYANETKEAIEQAKIQGDAYIAEAHSTIAEAQNVANTYKTAVDNVADHLEDITLVSQNTGHIRTVSENIDDITTVSEYLTATEDTEIEVPTDFGVIGSEEEVAFEGDTALEVVARNIQLLQYIYQNLDKILMLADDNRLDDLMYLANKIKEYIEETESILESVNLATEEMVKHKEEFKAIYAEAKEAIDDFYKELAKLEVDITAKLTALVEEAKSYSEEAAESADTCIHMLHLMREEYKAISNALDEKKARIEACITKMADSIKLELKRYTSDAVDRVQTAAEEAVTAASEDAADAFDKAIQDKLEEVYDELDAKLLEKLNEIQKKIDDAMEVFNESLEDALQNAKDQLAQIINDGKNLITNEANEIFTKLDTKYNEMVSKIDALYDDFLDEVNGKVVGVYRLVGSVLTYADLKEKEATAKVGDVYIVVDEDRLEYAWSQDGHWEPLGRNKVITDLGVIGD